MIAAVLPCIASALRRRSGANATRSTSKPTSPEPAAASSRASQKGSPLGIPQPGSAPFMPIFPPINRKVR